MVLLSTLSDLFSFLQRVAGSQIWLSDCTFTFHFHALEKEMATHSRVLAWRIPGTGEPGGLPSMGSHRVGHDWSDIAAAAAAATSCVAGDDASAVSLRKVALLGPRPQAEEATGILRKWNPQEQQNHIISLRLREQPRTNAPHREESPAMKTHAGCPTDTVNRAESQGFCRGGTFKDLLSQRPSHRIRGRRPREGRTCPRPQGE